MRILPAKMAKKICGIYRFVHIPTGKCYVGSTLDIHWRRNTHLRMARNGDTNHFHRSLRELGIDSFRFEIVELCSAQERAEREKHYIKLFSSVYPNGFNLVEDPTRKTYDFFTPAVRARISDANKGKVYSAEVRKMLSERAKGNKGNLGRKFTIEHRQKMSKSQMGHKPSRTGPHTPETCRKIKFSHLKRWNDKITKMGQLPLL